MANGRYTPYTPYVSKLVTFKCLSPFASLCFSLTRSWFVKQAKIGRKLTFLFIYVRHRDLLSENRVWSGLGPRYRVDVTTLTELLGTTKTKRIREAFLELYSRVFCVCSAKMSKNDSEQNPITRLTSQVSHFHVFQWPLHCVRYSGNGAFEVRFLGQFLWLIKYSGTVDFSTFSKRSNHKSSPLNFLHPISQTALFSTQFSFPLGGRHEALRKVLQDGLRKWYKQ